MGGNALKIAKTRRYDRAEFDVISVELMDTLKKSFARVAMPLFYKNKLSFGDADIMVSTEGLNFGLREYIVETFAPIEIHHNGNCWSFDYKELQVDLITIAPEQFDSNYNYLSYNDLGNYIGKIAHGFGFKYGQEGLVYDHYFKGSNIGRVLVSKDYDKIYEFLGLDYNRWREGFNELEDIFTFIGESKFFNWEYLQLENNNRINRERDAKRKSYQSFLSWIDENVKDDNHRFPFSKDKAEYVDAANKFFPEAGLELEIRRLEYEHCRNLYIKGKFNGGDVMRKYGLKGKELGDAMSGFKNIIGKIFPEETYEDYIINSSVAEIYSDFDVFLTPVHEKN